VIDLSNLKMNLLILQERLKFERKRIHEWGLAYASLSAWWNLEANTSSEYAAALAKMISELDI